MEFLNNDQYCIEMNELCSSVKTFVIAEDYGAGMELVCKSMSRYPHSAELQNLLGIVLEKTGNHPMAMRHFQAALALDPEYLPAKHNLYVYGTFFTRGNCAFDNSDVTLETSGDIEILYDRKNTAYAVHKNKIEFDEHGIGHVVRK